MRLALASPNKASQRDQKTAASLWFFGPCWRRYSTLCVTVVTGSFVNYKDLKGHIYVYNYNLRNRSE